MKAIELLRKNLCPVVILAACAGHVLAFDPISPPPQWTTQTQMVAQLNRIVFPSVQYQQVTVEEALEFLRAGRPESYSPAFGMDTALQKSTARISINEKDITMMEVLARIADQSQADIVISPGRVTLQARKPSSALKNP